MNISALVDLYLFVCCFLYLGGLWGHHANSVNNKESSLRQRSFIVPATLRKGNFESFSTVKWFKI